MQIIENWAHLIGIIIGILPAQQAGFVELQVRVERIQPVEGFPDLLRADTGDVVVIQARTAQADSAHDIEGARFDAHVRAAGPPPLRYFVAPDWRAGGG